MRLITYRRKEAANYAPLQDFLDELARGMDAPNVFEIFSEETAQVERLTVALTRKLNFPDNLNHQELTAKVNDGMVTTLGVKGILGQPRRVYLNRCFLSEPNARSFDWQANGTQAIDVVVKFSSPVLEPVLCSFDIFGNE